MCKYVLQEISNNVGNSILSNGRIKSYINVHKLRARNDQSTAHNALRDMDLQMNINNAKHNYYNVPITQVYNPL